MSTKTLQDLPPQGSPVSHGFIGRLTELQNLKEHILNFILDTSGNAVQLIQITGPPAIGKTLLAKQCSREIELECVENGLPFKSHFIDLQKETRMVNVLKYIGSELGFSLYTQREFFRELISKLHTNVHKLLVLDGIEDILTNDGSGGEFLEFCEQLLSHISQRNRLPVFLILTSTVQCSLPRSESKLYTLQLTPLTLDESKEGLISSSGDVHLGEYIDDLAEFSVGFPIAILLIGVILKSRYISPKELVERLRQDWIVTLLSHVSGDNKNKMIRVRSVINICLESLPIALRKDYAKLAYIPASFTLETANFITSARVLPAKVATRSPAAVKHDLLLPLYERSLIEIYHLLDPRSYQERFHIHQFIKYFVEEKYHLLECDLNEVRNRYCVFYGELLLKITPLLEANYAAHLSNFTIEIRNVEKLLREAIHCVGDNMQLFLDVAYKSNFLIETFLPTEDAVEFYKACLNAAQNKDKPGGVNRVSEARMLLMYGRMLGAAKTDFELEHEQYVKAMRLLRPYGDTFEMVTLLYCLAENFHSRGRRRDEAIEYLQESVAILDRLQTSASESSTTELRTPGRQPNKFTYQKPEDLLFIQRSRANATYMLGKIYAWIGKTRKAERYHFESLVLKRRLWGENHPSIGDSYNALSLVYEKAGDQEKAARFCFLGLDVKQRFLKEPSNAMIVSLNNAARHMSQQRGDQQRAIDYLDTAYKMRKKLGLDHRDTSLILNNKGKIFSWMCDWENAMMNFERAVQLRHKYLGAHASTASSMYLLGVCYLKLGRHHQAVESLTRSLDMLEEVHMKEQPLSGERANTLESLAESYHGVGNLEKAVEFYHRTIDELHRLFVKCGEKGQTNVQETFQRKISAVQIKFDSMNKELGKSV